MSETVNNVVHGLWVGNRLSLLEMLTLHSFSHHGYTFKLWVYNELQNTLPPGVELHDAATIIPRNKVFAKKRNDSRYGIGAGSFGAPFSDLFRYKLLYEHGGWWVDMDITCLKPFDQDTPYVFRAHPLLPMIGNVMYCPPRSALMEAVYREASERCTADTDEWLLPNKILNKHVEQQGLQPYIYHDFSNRDWWQEVKPYLYRNKRLPENWQCLHWMNEEWRSRGLNKDYFVPWSAYGRLLQQYQVFPQALSLFEKLSYGWRFKTG